MKKPFSTKRGANVPLTGHGAKGPGQKGYLSQLAKEAYRFLIAKGAIEGETEKEFRQRESIEACGRRISEAVNGDFELIEARFLMLMGRTKRAFDSAVKADTNDERQARYKLAQLCAKRGIAVPALEGASVMRIWAVYFNIKNQPKRQAAKVLGHAVDLQAELVQAVKEERYEDAAKLKAAISALQSQPAESADDDIPF
jgi:hypothetical protein